jgi:hypothetical protein
VNEGAQEVLASAKAADLVREPSMKALGIAKAVVGNTMVLEIGPGMLLRIEVGGVAGEPLDGDSAAVATEEALDFLGAMRTTSIPKDDDLAAQVSRKNPEERNHLREANNRVPMKADVEAEAPTDRREGDGGDGRDLLPMSADVMQDRRRSHRRPSSADDREEQEPAFVEEDEVCFIPPGFFLSEPSRREANGGRLARCARRLCARVSADSTPGNAGAEAYAEGGSGFQTLGGLIEPREVHSTGPSRIPLPGARSPECRPTRPSDPSSVSDAGQDEAWTGVPSSRRLGIDFANDRRFADRLEESEIPRWDHILPSAVEWRGTVASEALLPSLWVSFRPPLSSERVIGKKCLMTLAL